MTTFSNFRLLATAMALLLCAVNGIVLTSEEAAPWSAVQAATRAGTMQPAWDNNSVTKKKGEKK